MHSVILYFGSFNPVHKGTHGRCGMDTGTGAVQRGVVRRFAAESAETRRFAYRRRGAAGHGTACGGSIALFAENESVRRGILAPPRPSYTVDTLSVLTERYPDTTFSLLVGSDIPGQITQWKEWRKLLDNYKIYVYPRRDIRLLRRIADSPYSKAPLSKITPRQR